MIEPLPLTRGHVVALAMAAAALATLGIPAGTSRRRAFSGVLILGLALASAARLDPGGEPGAAGAITLGIAILGALILIAALVVTHAEAPWSVPAHWWVRLTGMVAIALGVGPLLSWGSSRGWPIALATVLGLSAAGAAAGFLGRRLSLGAGWRWLDARWLTAGRDGWSSTARDAWSSRLMTVHVAATIVALVAPHLHTLLGALTVSALSGILLERRTGRAGRFPVVLPLVMLVLAFLWFVLARVAGAMPLGLLALRDAPYSLAFETLIALPLALTAWSLLGLWPFHAVSRGPLTAVLGAAVLVKLVAPVLPHGLAHYQPLLYPLAVLAAWHAAAVDRDEELITALGALGLFSGQVAAGWAGVGLTAIGVLIVVRRRVVGRELALNPRGRFVAGVAVVAAAMLLVPVLSGALGAEVFYSVLTVGGAVAGLWKQGQ